MEDTAPMQKRLSWVRAGTIFLRLGSWLIVRAFLALGLWTIV
jgi:hypothetical protein